MPPSVGTATGITTAGGSTCLVGSTTLQPVCFGNNKYGQTTIPETISSQPFKSLSGGEAHVCGVTLGNQPKPDDPDASITDHISQMNLHTPSSHTYYSISQCWGDNMQGQSSVPALLQRQNSSQTLSAGEFHTCGLSIVGVLYCWGENQVIHFNGQVVNTGECNIPDIVLNSRVRSISAGNRVTCAVLEVGGGDGGGAAAGPNTEKEKDGQKQRQHLGKVLCWGETDLNKIPQVINGGRNDVATVAAGGYHVCAVTKEGIGRCWGDNLHGQTAVEMRDMTDMVDVWTGQWTTCYINSARDIKCIGSLGAGVSKDIPQEMMVKGGD